MGVGAYPLAWLVEQAGPAQKAAPAVKRSRDAVYARLRLVAGRGGLRRGSLTLREAERTTGYARSQILRARTALCQRWVRTSSSGSWLLSEDQVEAIGAWLKTDYWSIRLRLEACLRCRSSERLHRSGGLCEGCFWRARAEAKANQLPTGLAQLRAAVRALMPLTAPTDRAYLGAIDARLELGHAVWQDDLRRIARLRRIYDACSSR